MIDWPELLRTLIVVIAGMILFFALMVAFVARQP